MKAADLLRSKNIRVTEKRRIILEKIIENKDPISAEEILEKLKNCPIHEVEKKIEKETGFIIKGHSFEFTGICPNCQKN